MTTSRSGPTRPWFAIGWFLTWGLFQAFAVVSVLNGTWERPAAFPAKVYDALIVAHASPVKPQPATEETP